MTISYLNEATLQMYLRKFFVFIENLSSEIRVQPNYFMMDRYKEKVHLPKSMEKISTYNYTAER